MSNHLVIEAEDVGKSFPAPDGTLTVLRGVSFALGQGETCAILGPSGSGKTTLLGLCAGLDLPSAGRMRLLGHDCAALDEEGRARLRREHIGFVFQNFQLFQTLTALENVLLPLELRGVGNPEATAIALLERVGLGERLHHRPAQLSGGEQQRVALARAFAHQPRVLFADEPTGNLDHETAARVLQMLFELHASTGATLVLVTHDIELARRCQRVIRLRAGHLVEDTRNPA
jgi:putative ABC transport system ATP-binding protein